MKALALLLLLAPLAAGCPQKKQDAATAPSASAVASAAPSASASASADSVASAALDAGVPTEEQFEQKAKATIQAKDPKNVESELSKLEKEIGQ